MGERSRYSKEAKIKACEDYIDGKGSFLAIAKSIGTRKEVVRRWYLQYMEHGEETFNSRTGNRSYSKEFKQSIVSMYLAGTYSIAQLGAKHEVPAAMIGKWINKHYNGIELRDYDPKGEIYTMKSRKTTYKERVEIVEWVIGNDMNYKEAASKYAVKYSLVYSWVQKYLKDGAGALEHKRRGPKPKPESRLGESSMSETEKLKYELERERELRKKAEFRLEVLKKKEEIEKKLRSRK